MSELVFKLSLSYGRIATLSVLLPFEFSLPQEIFFHVFAGIVKLVEVLLLVLSLSLPAQAVVPFATLLFISTTKECCVGTYTSTEALYDFPYGIEISLVLLIFTPYPQLLVPAGDTIVYVSVELLYVIEVAPFLSSPPILIRFSFP